MEASETEFTRTDDINRLKDVLVSQILHDLDLSTLAAEDRSQAMIDLMFEKFRGLRASLPQETRNSFFHDVINEVLGFGILQPLLDDPAVTTIMVNGKDAIFVEKNGQLSQTDIHFQSNEELTRLIYRNLDRLGLHLDPNNPTLDARIQNDARLNLILPPIAVEAPILTIQKFTRCHSSMQDLIDAEVLNEKLAAFIHACVVSHLNILITGLEGTGKTALLNAAASLIPAGERIVTIEEVPELNLPQKNVLRMETRLSQLEVNSSTTNPGDLIRLALRMRPDRLIMGNLRGSECLALLQAMNSGSQGTLATLHASSATDAIARLETLCLLTGLNLPENVIHEQIASAVDLIIHLARLKNGSSRIITVTEISGMEADDVVLTDIFHFEQTGIDSNGKILGELRPTGIRPLFTSRLEANGFKFSEGEFGASLLNLLHNSR